MIELSQDAEEIALRFVQNDPLSFDFKVLGKDLTGTWVGQIRRVADPTSELYLTLTVTATVDGDDTNFLMTASDSTNVPSGECAWALKMDGGTTLLVGPVYVTKGVVGS